MATINGTSVGGMTLQIDYSYTQNTTANTTTVTAKLQLVGHYALYATALSGSYISVGGSKTEYSKTISYDSTSATTTTVLATKTVTVSHNNDGTATCALAGTFVMNGSYRGNSVGTMSVSSTITLPTIPRSSGLTVATSVNTGSALSGTVTPSSTSFNHKVELKVGSTVKQTITLATGTNTFSATIPHSWFPSSTSGTVAVVLSTYNGTTLIATTTQNVTANVPSTVVPSVSAFTAASSVTSGTFANLYVQGKTTAKLTATATAGDGSTIASYAYSGLGINSTLTTNTATTATLASSGSQTYTVTVKDARGRTASKTVTITVYPYAAPTISSVSVQRCDSSGNLSDSGTYAKYTVNSTYSTVNSKNTRTVTAAYSSDNGSTYSAETTLQAATDTANAKTGTYGGGSLATTSSYIIRFTIKDAYGATSTITTPLQSAYRPININASGKGVSIGAMSTKNEFECSMNADFNKNVNIDGKLTLTGGLSSALSIANGGTGATTASGIASSHHHANKHNSNAGGGTSGYIKIASFTISSDYMNQGVWFKLVRRVDAIVTDVSVTFKNTESSDPDISSLTYFGPAPVWINKRETSIWDLYVQKAEAYDHISVLDYKQGAYSQGGISVSFLGEMVTSLPSGAISGIKLMADYVTEQGVSGAWSYRKWNSGYMEVYGTVSQTPTVLNNGTNSITATMPVSFVDTNYVVSITPAKCALQVSAFGDCNASSDKTHTVNSFILSYKYNYSTAYAVNFNIVAVGKWK